jgi:hypothetical protein
LVAEIGYNLLDNNFYHALKLCKELVEYEHGILNGTMNIQEKNITSPQQEAAPES